MAGPADGPVVLLLHGFPQSAHQWRHQLRTLAAAGYRAVAPDQRGYSPRARPEEVEGYHVDRLVEDVLAVIDLLATDPVHLVGHDWGGMVGWAVAARHPDRLRTWTAVSTPHPRALSQALASSADQAFRSSYVRLLQQPRLPERLLLAGECAGLRALFANTGYSDREAMEEHVSFLCDEAALTAALNWYRALDPDSLAAAGPVRVPTLYVWSSDDPALGRVAAEGTAAHVSGRYRFVELEGVSHWVPEEAAEELNRLLVEHLGAAVPDAQ